MEKWQQRQEGFCLLPPDPGVCAQCATAHAADEPHNYQSLYYQMRFRIRNGRWPTWEDAMAHCDEDVKEIWRDTLTKLQDIQNAGIL